MFDKKQLDILNQELDSSRIKTRDKGNISLSYIEGHDVIETANKVAYIGILEQCFQNYLNTFCKNIF